MVATTLMLVVLVGRLWVTQTTELQLEDSLSFGLIAGVYLMTLVYAFWLRDGHLHEWNAWVQLGGDVVVATSLVYLTGGAESPFSFAYLIAVLAGAILFFQKGALITAGASSLAFCALVLAFQLGGLSLPFGASVLSPARLAFILASNTLAQFLIAVLAGYLSRQLHLTRGYLSASQSNLKALSALQHQILASMPSGLITCDPEGRLTYLNRAAEQILDTSARAVLGESVESLLPGMIGLGPTARRVELEAPTASGRKLLGLTASRLGAPAGSVLIVFQDLTQLHQMEQELKRADHLSALGRLSAQLAHEIRNPLAAMRGSAQMLREGPDQDATRRLVDILVREADRLHQLLEDFLRFARPVPPARRTTELDALLLETVEMMRSDPNAKRVSIETQVVPLRAKVDPDQLKQVLLNLVRNAIEAVQGDGRIRVQLENSEKGSLLRVWDSGGGIPAEDLSRIFEPFYTTKASGTGLGLSTAHSIVRAHGGHLRVSSSAEAGTEFTIEIPHEEEAGVARTGR